MKFYRYYDVPTSYEYNNGARIMEEVFYLVRETPCGYWISRNRNYDDKCDGVLIGTKVYKYGSKRWISKTTRKRHAYPTKEQAMESFVARKRRQVAILTAQLEQAKVAWAAGCRELQPINQEAKHLTKDAYDVWKNTPNAPKLLHG